MMSGHPFGATRWTVPSASEAERLVRFAMLCCGYPVNTALAQYTPDQLARWAHEHLEELAVAVHRAMYENLMLGDMA